MASYKGVFIAPSLTKTAGGKDMYVPLASDSGGSVIEGDVTITGTLSVDTDEVVKTKVTVLQEDLTTPQASAILDLSGGVGQNGPAGSSIYRFSKVCGPSAGAQYQDHLHLFRLGPTGATNPIVSGILDIGPKMVADSSPAQNLASMYADLYVGGDVQTQKLKTTNGALANWLWYGISGQVGPEQANEGTVINFDAALPNPFTRPGAPAEAIPPGFYCCYIQGKVGQITLAESRPDRGGPPQAGLYDTLCYAVFTFWDGYVIRATGPGVPANQGAVFGRGNVTDATINSNGLFNNNIGAFVQGSQLVTAQNTAQGNASSCAIFVYRVC
jgi:hypothetical protein